MDPIDPTARKVGQGLQVLIRCQQLGLEAGHLACRGRGVKIDLAPDKTAHSWVDSKTLGVVHILVASEPPKNRLPEKGHEPVLDVLAQAAFNQLPGGHLAQPENLIQFPEGEQAPVRGDGCAPELKLQSAVKVDSQRALRDFTHWVFSTMAREERSTL